MNEEKIQFVLKNFRQIFTNKKLKVILMKSKSKMNWITYKIDISLKLIPGFSHDVWNTM